MSCNTNVIVVLILIFGSISAEHAAPTKSYYVFKLAKLNWYGAFLDCLSRDLQLATINSEAEQLAIEQAMKKADVANYWLWTSGTDQADEGSFVWMSTAQPISFSKWSGGQPDNAGGVEHCMHLWNNRIHNGDITWNDWECGQKLFYICEDKPTNC